MSCAVAGGGRGGPQEVENNYLAELSGEAGPVRRSPQGEGGRKAKTLAREGDNAILADLNACLRNRAPLPPPATGIPKNNSQHFAQRACRAPNLAMACLRRRNRATKRVAA